MRQLDTMAANCARFEVRKSEVEVVKRFNHCLGDTFTFLYTLQDFKLERLSVKPISMAFNQHGWITCCSFMAFWGVVKGATPP